MRHKTITLCPTTYEIAKEMPNFSAWIRQELLKRHATIAVAKIEKEIIHQAYCNSCDIIFSNRNKYMVELAHYCNKCHEKTAYIGVKE